MEMLPTLAWTLMRCSSNLHLSSFLLSISPQEQGKEGFLEEALFRAQVQILEKEIELIKKNPDMNLTKSAKKIRQKGYKDNHKKKKLELIDASNHA
ncbi:hypothetical protein FCM35_KLT06270 [Carex littledalei]|uniref:Uncharacterized protein n=1 Tax=Carex littledalei TaxID=544730 RepID=A0A833QZ00_9POAL|nr:hypothetical protein FCM35_KLT06270 [Carex littledalei]